MEDQQQQRQQMKLAVNVSIMASPGLVHIISQAVDEAKGQIVGSVHITMSGVVHPEINYGCLDHARKYLDQQLHKVISVS